jgi:hypothetical protein
MFFSAPYRDNQQAVTDERGAFLFTRRVPGRQLRLGSYNPDGSQFLDDNFMATVRPGDIPGLDLLTQTTLAAQPTYTETHYNRGVVHASYRR